MASDEMKLIELATAEKFLHLYNSRHGTNYEVVAQGEHPDIECRDALTSMTMALEITLLEDLPGEIAFLLGRGEKPALSPTTGLPATSFSQDVLPKLKARLEDKLLSTYGPSTALVIRQVSPLWSSNDWANFAGNILTDVFQGKESNYGRGVWILCRDPSSWVYVDDIFELSALATSSNPCNRENHDRAERLVGKVIWERYKNADFVEFSERSDVDPVVRIPSPHGCEEAVLICFVSDEPYRERERAIRFYRDEMVYYCICGRGKFRLRCG